LKRKTAAREAAKLTDSQKAEIAMPHANVVYCDIATRAAKEALLAEISELSFDSSDAESESESCESSSEENSWESEGGGVSAVVAAEEAKEKGGLSAATAAAAAGYAAGLAGPRASHWSTARGHGAGGGGSGDGRGAGLWPRGRGVREELERGSRRQAPHLRS
jgi:hypothetical protein